MKPNEKFKRQIRREKKTNLQKITTKNAKYVCPLAFHMLDGNLY